MRKAQGKFKVYRYSSPGKIIVREADRETDQFWIIGGRRNSKTYNERYSIWGSSGPELTFFRTPQEAIKANVEYLKSKLEYFQSRTENAIKELEVAKSDLLELHEKLDPGLPPGQG